MKKKSPRNLLVKITFLFVINSGLSQCISAQPGSLDSSFGINGKVINNNFCKNIWCTVLQPDDKIITGGHSLLETILMARYNPDGSLDTTFGEGGTIVTDLAPMHQLYNTWARDMILQPDGKIVITGVGYRYLGGFEVDYDVFLIRYNTDGSLDKNFGNEGVVIKDFGSINDDAETMSLQTDGKILIGGYSLSSLIGRFNPDGSLDVTFNGTGYAKFNSGFINSIVVQPDFKLLLGGKNTDRPPYRFMVIRVKENGLKDSGFGTNGVVITDFATGDGYEAIYSIALQADGKIIAAGGTDDATGNIALARYDSDGSLDATFGTGGKVITKVGSSHSYATKVLIDDEKIIVAGWAKDFVIARYNNDGSLNRHFGTDGITLTDFDRSAGIQDAALQSDGKIVAVGYRGYNALLARYENNKPVIISFKRNTRTVIEGNTGVTNAHFEIVLNKASLKDISVSLETKEGTATAGLDYKSMSGIVTIKAGEISKKVKVEIMGDSLPENNENFSLQLNDPVNAIIGKYDTITCIIKNDDSLFTLNNTSRENIENSNTTTFKIYPNPVKDRLEVTGLSATQKTSLSITDISGIRMAAITISGSGYSWNLSQLKPGSYILKIESVGVAVTRMFIKE